MVILRADIMGMCGGVRRALRLAERTLAEAGGTPVFSLGPLVHNPGVVADLRARGLTPAEDLPAIREGTVIIRAHGVGPGVGEQCRARGLRCVDATCPDVLRIHRLVGKHAARGEAIVVVGEHGHGEVAGIVGHAPAARVIASAAEAETVTLGSPTFVVAQSTFPRAEYERICDVLRGRLPGIVVEDTTCPSTEKRTESLQRLARGVDALIVIGSRQSANTRRLHHAAQATGKPSWLVETAEEIPPEAIGFERIGLSAGASTPDRLVDEVESRLRAAGSASH